MYQTMISVRYHIIRPCRVTYGHSKRSRVSRVSPTRVSPVTSDLMTAFDARGTGLSAMLFVFLVGRIVIDSADQSIRDEHAYYSSDTDSDDETTESL